jgi:hypothetical protein
LPLSFEQAYSTDSPDYLTTTRRCVSVDSRGIQEALRKICGAGALADELSGTKAEGARAGK